MDLKFKAILVFVNILLFASCEVGYKEKIILKSNNIGLESGKVFLEMSILPLHEEDYILKEVVYNDSSVSPQYGGGFTRILSLNGKEITSKIYIPLGKNCDTALVDTLSSLFFKVPKTDTTWISFDNVKSSQCYSLQLLNRFHFINKLSFNKGDILLLEQQLVNNDTYKNLYFFDKKSLAIVKIKYLRGSYILEFKPKNGAESFFSKLLD